MTPTEANIYDVAHARTPAIRARARELGDVESDDDRLVGIVYRRALYYAQRSHSPAPTAQAAVAWAITDMHTVDVAVVDDESIATPSDSERG